MVAFHWRQLLVVASKVQDDARVRLRRLVALVVFVGH